MVEAGYAKCKALTDGTDLRGICRLYQMVVKARKFMDVIRGNRNQLYAAVFDWTLEKLPADVQSQVDQEQKNLNTLIQFFQQKVKELAEAKANEPADEFSELFNCTFCKISGHHNNSCPVIKSMLCFNQFELQPVLFCLMQSIFWTRLVRQVFRFFLFIRYDSF